MADGSTDPLVNLKASHPRLLFTVADQERLVQDSLTDPLLAELLAVSRAEAKEVLGEPVTPYQRDENSHLLVPSRDVLRKVSLCALAWRLSGETKFKDRAWQELEAAAAWPTWNPSHFLDVAEMTTAFAIGYDWLYDQLTDAQRDLLIKTIAERALREGLPGSTSDPKNLWWLKAPMNWNAVCNSGLLLGALAIADREPDLSRSVIQQAVASVPLTFSEYEPDGAYPEGPAYWGYGTNYLMALLHGLHTALGSDFGLRERAAILPRSAFYRLAMSGPAGLFNYGDGAAWDRAEPALFGISRFYDRPDIATAFRKRLAADLKACREEMAGQKPPQEQRRQEQRYRWLQVAWYDGRPAPPTDLTLAAVFRGKAEIAVMRSAWDDPNAAFIGFKVGDNSASHAHLDLGSFVFDANGIRWAHDLGPDAYALPGYFKNPQRWEYFRNATASHNTLTINGRNQPLHAVGRITAWHHASDRTHAVADLTEAYAGQATSVRRGLALLPDHNFLVQDEIEGLQSGSEVRWAMMTNAEITLHGNRAVLANDGQTMTARILEPVDAVFSIEAATPKSKEEKQNEGFRLLTVRLKGGGSSSRLRLIVTLAPDESQPNVPIPLADWTDDRKP